MKFSRLVKTTAAMLSLAVALGCTACAPDKQTPTPEPKVNYADVFVFMGQSNMAGRGEAADAIDCEWGHGYEYRAVSGSDEDGWLYPVEEPFGAEENNAALSDGENGDGKKSGGMVSSFCEAYYQTTGIPAVAVSASVGGTSITQWAPGTSYFNEAARRLSDCIDFLKADGDLVPRRINMVWCQGCSDGGKVAAGTLDYVEKLKAIVDGMQDLGEGKSVERCFIVTLSEYSDGVIQENKTALADLQINLCDTDDDFVLASMKFRGAPAELRDDPHFHQGVYNVAGWDAGKNAATFIMTGSRPECRPYQAGEATALAAQFGIDLRFKENNAAVPPEGPAPEAPALTEADVFIFMGQSNMAGRGEAADSIVCEEGHGYEFRAVTGSNASGWLYPIEEPFGNAENNSDLSDGVGNDGNKSGDMVAAFCESYYSETGVPVVAVSASVGGSSIYHWSPTSSTYNYFNEAARRLTACVDYLVSSNVNVRHINMVWCQGCSDAGQVASGKMNYVSSLKKIVDGMQNLGAGKSIEKCFIITLSEYTGGAVSENKVALANLQINLCETDDDFALASVKFRNVPASLRDDPHFHQGVYNVAGWDAGKNVATFIKTGNQPECEPYKSGEAAALASRFGIDLQYKEY